MTSKIQIRRGALAQLPTLDLAEPGFATDTKELYIGDGIGNTKIGSSGSGVSTFTGLTDTPTSFSGTSGKYLKVNDAGDGIEFGYIEFDLTSEEAPLIPETAVSGTYFVNFEAGRLLIGQTGAKPDLVFNGPVAGLAFADAAEEACFGSFKIPYSWNTDSDIKFTINFMNDEDQSGATTCVWKLDYHAYALGEMYTDKTTTTVDISYSFPSDAPAGTFWIHELSMASDDPNNTLSRGDVVTFKFYRDGIDAADNMDGDAVLVALMIELQTGQHITGDA